MVSGVKVRLRAWAWTDRSVDRQGMDLPPSRVRVTEMVVVDQDTWGPRGLTWDQASVRTVTLTHT